MELRQLRYFVRVAELGSMGRAANELGVVVSALSQQISRLEGDGESRGEGGAYSHRLPIGLSKPC